MNFVAMNSGETNVMNTTDKTEEVIKEVCFLSDNDKWGGKVQVIRVTVPQGDGTSRVFINKRLMFTGNQRYINLPRNGIEELTKAIVEASDAERVAHEALITELNARPSDRKPTFNTPPSGRDRRR